MGITGITAFRNVPSSTSSWVTGYQLYYGLTSGSARHDRPGRGPVGHCPLDGHLHRYLDRPVVDASGEGNTGTISGATRITEGRFGKALTFDGVDDWVTVNDAPS